MNPTKAQSWQGFVQQAVRLLALGYRQWSLTVYPSLKRDRWDQIDQKRLQQHPLLALSKYQRARRKQRGLLNAHLLRWEAFALLLATTGHDDSGLTTTEKLVGIHQQTPCWPISDVLVVRLIQRRGHFTVALDRDCHRDLVAYYQEQAQRATLAQLQAEFQRLERTLPAWSGLLAQKKALRRALVQAARRAGRAWSATDFPIANRKRTVRVFEPQV